MGETATCTRRAFHALARPSPPHDLHDRIVAAIRVEAVRQRRRRRLRRYAALGLTTLLTLVAFAHGAR